MRSISCMLWGIFIFVSHSLAADWPMWGGSPGHNMVNDAEKNLPTDWNLKTEKNIKWKVDLGSQSYTSPVISNGNIYVGTNNEGTRNPEIKGDKGVIMCFRESDGKFLWQAVHDKLTAGRVNDWPYQGICSTPTVEGDRVYYVSNRCQLVCVDAQGFYDNQNNGPFTEEQYTGTHLADIIWIYDMIDELGAFPHNLATSSPIVVGDLVFLLTGNGVDETHLNMPSPASPSFIAVNKNTGKLVWENNAPADKVLHGQWSSPAYGTIKGRPQVVFPGGDGWLYSFEPTTGKLFWKFDCNPKKSIWKLGGMGTRNNLISTPVIYDDKVLIGVGQDPEHGSGIGQLWAIDGSGNGDVTSTHQVWHLGGKDFGRTMSTVAIKDGLLYIPDLTGFLYCIDYTSGTIIWRDDLKSAVWGSAIIMDNKVYIGDEDGVIHIYSHHKEKKLLAEIELDDSAYSTPVAANGVLYLQTKSRLYAIKTAN